MSPPENRRSLNQHPETSQSSQLRQRKCLPPLSAPPTDSTDTMNPAVDAETKSEVEQLLRSHVRFARAFKLNDTAMLLPFLDKDVVFTMADGTVVKGASAVLGYLVGPKLSKLSGALHVKGRPTRSGLWQSAFVYEHGIVFKEPLYSEVIDWKPHTSVVNKITHTRLSPPLEAGPPKSLTDVVKVVATLPHRLSISDEDDHPMNGRRSSCSRPSLTTSLSNASDSDGKPATGVLITRLAVITKLTPIRKRKLVNAYVTVESEDGELLWKSTVAKKQTLPVWNGVDLEIPPQAVDSMTNQPASTPVVVTLWDAGFLRALRVATAQVTANELLRRNRAGVSSLELKPMGFSSTPIELSLSIVRQDGDSEWRPRRLSVLSDIAAIDAATDDVDSVTTISKVGYFTFDASSVDKSWVGVAIVALTLLICMATLWIHSRGQIVAE